MRVFALACLAEDFVTGAMRARHPDAWMPLQRGFLMSTDDVELPTNERVVRFGLGTPLYYTDNESQKAPRLSGERRGRVQQLMPHFTARIDMAHMGARYHGVFQGGVAWLAGVQRVTNQTT